VLEKVETPGGKLGKLVRTVITIVNDDGTSLFFMVFFFFYITVNNNINVIMIYIDLQDFF